ncbi:apoptosis facilitator Bcl-2-like protein 14 [Hyla sarda]|uniref:apoptosis facilitator Bcl-2-like protein 14 n=1 Tax=Hyla sarda TaxID=327740 RepID=UPI0024C3AA79|nr:apoptosis facilitator Bcl-2-like protein 14 [Hyla sarda]XP_056373941.1 apoptosis facilitator Bcl-2-like protein 14 [Hyla sarda]
MVSVQDDTLDEVPLQEEDSMEFRMLMAYAQRTLPSSTFEQLKSRTPKKKNDGVASNGEGHTDKGNSAAPPKKEKKKRRWKFTPSCLRPPREKTQMMRSHPPESAEEARVGGLAERLKNIVQELERQDQERPEFRVLRREYSIQHDGDSDEDLIHNIVEFLRREGDKINDQIAQKPSFFQGLQSCWSYGFFQRLTETYVEQMVPENVPEDVRQSSKIALCVHATTALTALDSHPMNRMFGFGARYLKENYSQWIKERGGWEQVMGIPDSQEEESEEE